MPDAPDPSTSPSGPGTGAKDADSGAPMPVPMARVVVSEPLPIGLADEDCPRCHAPLAHEAVMCVKCGYDLKANIIREPEVGIVAPVAPVKEAVFVTPGRGSPQVLATCGVFLTVGAMVAAGLAARQYGAWVVIGSVALVLYSIALHTGTGVVAVIGAARLSEERFTRLELAAARMFVAVALFYSVASLNLPLGLVFLSQLVKWTLAMGVYFGAVWFFFKKDRFGAALIALAHFAMFMLLQLGAGLAGWVAAGQSAAVTQGP